VDISTKGNVCITLGNEEVVVRIKLGAAFGSMADSPKIRAFTVLWTVSGKTPTLMEEMRASQKIKG